jgi:carboxyl-terminal processing protease
MKLKRTILGPILVVLLAFVSGGWLLQRGVSAHGNAFGEAQILNAVLNRISTDYVDPHPAAELHRMAVEGLLREIGDPHTNFMSAEQYAELRMSTTGEYGGLGIQISERDGWITVISPLPGTPAERAGLLPGDRIVEIEGESTAGWSDEDAVKVLRGPRGAPVDFKIARVGVSEPIPYTIVRDEIKVQSVRTSYMLEPGVGYVKLDVFSETSTQELRAAIAELSSRGMTGLVLDLRANPGGLLDQGVSVSDLFLSKGQAIVETRSRRPDESMTFRASTPDATPGLEVVVLVDGYSASAAEIVAGALQDHDRALVVGDPTFGKGSVQTLFPLPGGNFLKMTTGRWYTPVGRSIQRESRRNGDAVELLDEEPISEEGVPLTPTEAGDSVKRQAYRTAGGRIVYGGGGIVPDLIVRPDTLTTGEREFFEAASKGGSRYSDVVFRFAVDHVRENPDLERGFPITPAMRSELFDRFIQAGLEVTREQFQAAQRLIDQRIAYEIALAKWGLSVAAQRSTASDKLVRTAAELLRDAPDQSALFQRAANQGRVARP